LKSVVQARVYVDFNEMLSADEVLLAQQDSKPDSAGNVIDFIEGKKVAVYMDDEDESGRPDRLIADGIALLNTHGGWSSVARWILKIDARGIRHESSELKA
jgi:hypothetical protein